MALERPRTLPSTITKPVWSRFQLLLPFHPLPPPRGGVEKSDASRMPPISFQVSPLPEWPATIILAGRRQLSWPVEGLGRRPGSGVRNQSDRGRRSRNARQKDQRLPSAQV